MEKGYPEAAVERAMKVQDVIMRAMAKRITWWEERRFWEFIFERCADGVLD